MSSVTYVFAFEHATEVSFAVDLERAAGGADEARDLPEWTRLGYHQCPSCPVRDADRCPPAVDAYEILEHFRDTFSFARADVRVLTERREVRRSTDVQSALQSLLGLVMATSGCPVLGRLRGLAELHLPFASSRETIYRTCAHHLLRQYFAHRRGEPADWDLAELRQLYEQLQEVNVAFGARICAAADRDANLNALVKLFSISVLVSSSLDDELTELEPLFTSRCG